MPAPEPTLFERLIRRLQRMALWQKLLLALLLLALPYGIATVEGVQPYLINRQTWRDAYFPTVCLIYILAVAPLIWRAEKEVGEGLRPLLKTELNPTEPFEQGTMEHKAWWRSSLGDLLSFGMGALGGAFLVFSSPTPDLHLWSIRYWVLTILVMYGALVWLIYAALGSARYTALLHRYVVHQDPFDLSPFEPVGRQGLILAMIFIGTITLSLLFVYSPTIYLQWTPVAIYSFLVLITVLIFFTVMWPAHRVLKQVKEEKIALARRRIGQALRTLEGETEEGVEARGADRQKVATEVPAWITMEQRLKQTRAWPYDTEMLRTLFLSVLTPLFVSIARVVGTYLTEGHF